MQIVGDVVLTLQAGILNTFSLISRPATSQQQLEVKQQPPFRFTSGGK